MTGNAPHLRIGIDTGGTFTDIVCVDSDAGTIVIVCAYAASLLVVERLFKIVKPKLLKLPWFARLWNWFVALRDRALGWLRRARDLVLCRS